MASKLVSTTNTEAAERKVKTAFRGFTRIRNLDDYQFDFEHGQWFVTRKSTGALWSVVDTSSGLDFEVLEYGDEA